MMLFTNVRAQKTVYSLYEQATNCHCILRKTLHCLGMEVVLFPVNCHNKPFPVLPQFRTPKFKHLSQSTHWNHKTSFCRSLRTRILLPHRTNPHHKLLFLICNQLNEDSDHNTLQDDEVDSLGVKAALSVLKFYKREISPLLPKSCRYVPTCSEYSMEAYKRYGFVKGTVLTAWRICRCNPFGGSGFDPPRWFDERSPPQQ